jgi:hypothetical protein
MEKEAQMIKAAHIPATGEPTEFEWDKIPPLHELQEYVGGTIERILVPIPHWFNPERYHEMLINEDALRLELEINRRATIITGYRLFGDVLLFEGTPMQEEGRKQE